MDEFMADQNAADHQTHQPLLDRDRCQPIKFKLIGGDFLERSGYKTSPQFSVVDVLQQEHFQRTDFLGE